MMLYTIIEVEDQAMKNQLAHTCDEQPFIAKSPYVLVFLADYQRWYDYYLVSGAEELCNERGLQMRTPEEGDFLLACCDTLIAAQSAVIAAESLGVGSCYIGDILEKYEIHQQLFGLPKYAVPVTMLCFGYPTPAQAARPLTTRFAKEYIVHKNAYRRMSPSELNLMFQERNQQFLKTGNARNGITNVGLNNFIKKFMADFSAEMNRSSQVMIDHWAKPVREV
jgi:FMN reductase (NADPH)/FMN reductase [NAD(P)H]